MMDFEEVAPPRGFSEYNDEAKRGGDLSRTPSPTMTEIMLDRDDDDDVDRDETKQEAPPGYDDSSDDEKRGEDLSRFSVIHVVSDETKDRGTVDDFEEADLFDGDIPTMAPYRRTSSGISYHGDPVPESHMTEGVEEEEESKRKKKYLFTAIMTKAKICLAAYQIAAVTPWSLPAVHFPAPTTAVLKVASLVEFNFLQLGSTDCILKMSYFEKLVVLTVLPFGLAIVGSSMYVGLVLLGHRRRRIEWDVELRRIIYCILLLFYVALPACSSYTFRYFSCLNYDRGEGRSLLKVLAVDPTIKCTQPVYDRWFPYIVLSILVWPVGCPLIVGFMLWARRKRFNPDIDDDDAENLVRSIPTHQIPLQLIKDKDEELLEETAHTHRAYRRALRQLVKAEKRNTDIPLRAFLFLYEEYLPRCYMFPVYEAVRRVFLTGILAMFYPGSLAQIAIGFFGALVSYKIFDIFQPYIDDNDNILSEVAQLQLVLLFFAAFLVFASENLESKEHIFRSKSFAAFIIVVVLSSVVVAIYFIMVNIFGYEKMRENFTTKLEKRTHRVRNSVSHVGTRVSRRLNSSWGSVKSTATIDGVQLSKKTRGPSPQESIDDDRPYVEDAADL